MTLLLACSRFIFGEERIDLVKLGLDVRDIHASGERLRLRGGRGGVAAVSTTSFSIHGDLSVQPTVRRCGLSGTILFQKFPDGILVE